MHERLSKPARRLVAEKECRLSPIAALELGYLHEVGRAGDPLTTMLATLRQAIGLEVVDVATMELVETAWPLSWTRDPFDRLIAAHAIVANAPLVTADETIRENLSLAIWD